MQMDATAEAISTDDNQMLLANELEDDVDEVAQEENNDSGIDPDPEHTDPSLKFSDKASFRQKSTSFLKVLEDSAKYRKLPEPKGKKPGRLQEIETPRGLPAANMEDDDEALISPRRAQDSLRPLARARAGQGAKADDNSGQQTTHKSRYSRYEDLPVTPRPNQGRTRGDGVGLVSLPPVVGGRQGLMAGGAAAGGAQDRTALALSYSRQGNDVLAKLRMSNHGSTGAAGGSSSNSTPGSPIPGSPRVTDRQPRGRKDGKILSLDTQDLLSPRGSNK